jgi:hypothetical protein
MSDKQLIREHYTASYGHCQGFTHVEPRTVNETGDDARIDGVRSYTVQTFRDPERGIYQFVQVVEDNEVKRICLPPAITAILQQQIDTVNKKARRAHGKLMGKRNLITPQKGIVPPQFKQHRKKGKR